MITLVGTICVHGSSGEVMAPLGVDFYRGERVPIRITQVDPDEDTPLPIRQALVGLVVSAIFTKQQLMEVGSFGHLPDGCRLAYAAELIELLRSAKFEAEACLLAQICPGNLDMYVFEPGTFEVVA